MASINLIKASDGTGNASTATVQTVRNSGVTTIIVDTVNNIPATFMGSMGTPHTFVDPVTSEEITVISEATAVDFTGHVSGANLEIDSIAPGYTDLGSAVGDIVVIRPTTDWANNLADTLAASHDNDGTLKAGAVDVQAVLANAVVEAAKIKDGAVTNAKLATSAGEIGGAWVAYTPTWTASTTNPTVGNGTLSGYYTKIGKTVHFRISIVFGTTTNAGSGAYFFGIPVAARAVYGAFYPVGTVMTTDNLVEQASGAATIWSSTTVACFVNVAGAKKTEYVQHAYPYAWATDDKILISGTYEAA